jgi:hypothetical protein
MKFPTTICGFSQKLSLAIVTEFTGKMGREESLAFVESFSIGEGCPKMQPLAYVSLGTWKNRKSRRGVNTSQKFSEYSFLFARNTGQCYSWGV